MKKVIIPVLSIILVLALAFGVSAASVDSAKWTELLSWDADAAGNSEGTVTATADGFIEFEVEPGLWWPQAGIVYNDAIAPEGLEVIINCPEFTDPSPNGYFMIALSSVKPGDFGLSGPLGGRSYEITVKKEKVQCLSLFAGQYYAVEGVVQDEGQAWEGVADATPDKDARITFENAGENLKIKVNGKYLQSNDEDILVPKAAITNDEGKTFLTFCAVGYGGSGADGAIAIKYINGVAANEFAGAAGTYEGELNGGETSSEPAPSEPAPSEVVPSEPAPSQAAPETSCGNKA